MIYLIEENNEPNFVRFLAGGKIYPSQPAWKRDVNIESFSRDARLIIDDSALWEESDNYCYLSK